MQQGGNLEGAPLRLIEQALQSNPANLKALALAGTAAYERRDYAAAVGYWSRAQAGAPPDSDFSRGLQSSIADARAAGGAAVAPAAAGASISGRVSLAPALAARVSPDDTVFIFARAVDGPRMPLAIVKRRAAELPLSFSLDDSLAMSPETKLSAHAQVVVGARISRSGNALPQSGDLEGQSAPLANRAAGIELQIDRVRP
jgi:cytochrome c-type biogenesis protein CcmH